MIREYVKINESSTLCKTEFKKGDLVFCNIDPLFLTESVFDCGKFSKDIGICKAKPTKTPECELYKWVSR